MPSPNSIAAVTEFAYGRLLNPRPSAPGISLTPEGHLVVTVRGETMTRTDSMLVCSENLEIRPLQRRMHGQRVKQPFRRLCALEGEGYLVLSREQETFVPLRLERDLCFFREPMIWAIEPGLMWDVGVLPGTRLLHPIELVRAAGEGVVVLRLSGRLVAVKIAEDRPHRVHVDSFVGWIGNVVPMLEKGVPFLHCEGEGAVFVCLPAGGLPTEIGESEPV